MMRWFRSRRRLHAELANLERHAGELAARNARLEKSNASARRALRFEEAEHETTARALQVERSRVAALEARDQ